MQHEFEPTVRYAVWCEQNKAYISTWQAKSLTHEYTNDLTKIRSFKKMSDATKLAGFSTHLVVAELTLRAAAKVAQTPRAIKEQIDIQFNRFRELYAIKDMTDTQDKEFRRLKKKLWYHPKYPTVLEEMRSLHG